MPFHTTPVTKNEPSRICFGLLQTARSHDCFVYVQQWGFSFSCGLNSGHAALQIFMYWDPVDQTLAVRKLLS